MESRQALHHSRLYVIQVWETTALSLALPKLVSTKDQYCYYLQSFEQAGCACTSIASILPKGTCLSQSQIKPFFQELQFGVMGNCLPVARNDGLCEQQLLLHSQGRAVPKKLTYASAPFLYRKTCFIEM